ncbi:MAG: 50S ribosomal protein L21 [Deltaproteobacteria bacterium]|nr:50S ribosomal protein L21 [Deltaproteobacteria bacterium]
MYAVIRTGGKQYRVCEGDKVRVEKLAGEVGDTLDFSEVLMIGGERVAIGRPLVEGAKVSAQIVSQDRARKIQVYKFKRRKNYRRKAGHRQWFTELRVLSITV